MDDGNLPCEDGDTSHIIDADEVSKAKQKYGIDSANDHLHAQQLKNQGQVEAFLDNDTGHKAPTRQTSEEHCRSRR